MRTKSPQAGLLPAVVNSGQFASRKAWLPAQSWVRQTLKEPWKDRTRGSGIWIGNDWRVKLRAPGSSDAMGPLAITHFVGSPFWKFTSWKFPMNELNRNAELPTLKPD